MASREPHQARVDPLKPSQSVVGRRNERSARSSPRLLDLIVELVEISEHRRRRRHHATPLRAPPVVLRPAICAPYTMSLHLEQQLAQSLVLLQNPHVIHRLPTSQVEHDQRRDHLGVGPLLSALSHSNVTAHRLPESLDGRQIQVRSQARPHRHACRLVLFFVVEWKGALLHNSRTSLVIACRC